jgi:hypothetical protein
MEYGMNLRWTPARKAALLGDIDAGVLTAEEAMARYAISVDEFAEWRRLERQYGERGLRTTRTQTYRNSREPA